MHNILVTGGNGQLGNEMRLIAPDTPYSWTFTDVTCPEGSETVRLDITDIDAIRRIVDERSIDCIVNCAAYTNVDGAESDPCTCHRLNAVAPGHLATVMAERGGLLVHISTDYVFGGEPYNTPCTETQKGTPTGVYGSTKLEGENNILATGCRHVILRTAWLYSEFGKNFVRTMLKLTAEKPRLNVVFDQAGTPTYALDLARAIATILDTIAAADDPDRYNGIYNYSNEGVCSWYDFTQAIARMAGNSACDIQPCHSDEFPSPVKRPAYSVLDKTKVKRTFGVEVPYWTDSLRQCITRLSNTNV